MDTPLIDTGDGSEVSTKEFVFIDNEGEDVITVMTPEGDVIKKIPVGHAPHDIAASPDGEFVASANLESGTVSVIETSSLTVVQTISTGAGAHGVVFSPDGAKLYAVNARADTLSVIDTSSWQEMQRIPVDQGPEYVGVTPDGKQVFTTNLGAQGSVTLLAYKDNKLSVQKTMKFGSDPHGWAISPDGNKIALTNLGSNTAYILNSQTFEEISHIDSGATTEFAAFKDNNELWVTDIGAHYVSIVDINRNKVIDQIAVGETPHGIAFSKDKTLAFVPLYSSGEVVIIDVARRIIVNKIKTGGTLLHNAVTVSVKTS